MKRFVLLALVIAGCSLDNALVGGQCKSGYDQVGQSCVLSNPAATGPDASSDDGGSGGEASTVDPNADASVDDASVDAGTDARSPLDFLADDTLPGEVLCQNTYAWCNGTCIDVGDDGQNCGACGKICPSNICINGECQGAISGDVVLVGHDFTNAWAGSAQAKVLTNAITIPTSNPIRILSYEEGADPNAVAQARALLASTKRKVQIKTASKANLDSTVLARDYDVVIIHDTGDSTLGARWKNSLPLFAQKGGVVVALDGGKAHVSDLVSSAQLLQVGSHALLPESTHLVVAKPNDAVGTQVLSPYAAFGPPVAFSGVESGNDVNYVVRVDAPSAEPVVVHKTVHQ